MEMSEDGLTAIMDELFEMTDMHPVNGINLCRMEGMPVLFSIFLTNPHAEARIIACQILSSIVANDAAVQQHT